MTAPSPPTTVDMMVDRTAHDTVRQLLDSLEKDLDPGLQEAIRARHVQAAAWREIDRPPALIVPPWDQRGEELYPVAEAVADPARMLVNELRKGFGSVLDWIRIQDDRPLQIRPDYGIGLVASAFGARIEVVEDNPPWVYPLGGDRIEDRLDQALAESDPATAHTRGWNPRAIETLEYYADTLAEYPTVRGSIAMTLPDLQGPFDSAAMLWGSDILLALVTAPELVDRLLAAVARTMVHLHDRYRAIVGRELLPDGYSHQHGSIIRGNILLRCDSNLMMSPGMYGRQVLPHDRSVLGAVGGGSFHSCGRWMDNIPMVMSTGEVGSLDFGANQTPLNDMFEVRRLAGIHHKHLHIVTVSPRELVDGSAASMYPTGATLRCEVTGVREAQQLMADYTERSANHGT